MVDGREQSFHALVNTEFSTDLLHVLTRTTDEVERLDRGGPLARKISELVGDRPGDEDFVRLKPSVELREGLAIQAVRSTVAAQKNQVEARASAFWEDPTRPIEGGWIYDAPISCLRLEDSAQRDGVRLRFTEGEGGRELYEQLRTGGAFGTLHSSSNPHQRLLLTRMWRAGMLERGAGLSPRTSA